MKRQELKRRLKRRPKNWFGVDKRVTSYGHTCCKARLHCRHHSQDCPTIWRATEGRSTCLKDEPEHCRPHQTHSLWWPMMCNLASKFWKTSRSSCRRRKRKRLRRLAT